MRRWRRSEEEGNGLDGAGQFYSKRRLCLQGTVERRRMSSKGGAERRRRTAWKGKKEEREAEDRRI